MRKLLLYNLKEWIHIIFNYLIHKIQIHINKTIIQEKALNDEFINQGYSITKKQKKYFLAKDHLKIELRKRTTDNLVFKQIFIEEEYKPIIEYCKRNKIELKTMLDLGANIGLSSIYIKHIFPDIKICAIEPFESNFLAIQQNFLQNSMPDVIIKGAVWNKECYLSTSHNFRDGREWSITMTEDAKSCGTKAFTIQKIMKEYSFNAIDFLKIDVEGAESKIFDKSISDISFLKKIKIIAIEIHDEFNCREQIYSVLKEYNFRITTNGELTIGINEKK